jgi:hypothetical protein
LFETERARNQWGDTNGQLAKERTGMRSSTFHRSAVPSPAPLSIYLVTITHLVRITARHKTLDSTPPTPTGKILNTHNTKGKRYEPTTLHTLKTQKERFQQTRRERERERERERKEKRERKKRHRREVKNLTGSYKECMLELARYLPDLSNSTQKVLPVCA